MNKFLLLAAVSMAVVSLTFIIASEEEIFEEADRIINQKLPCSELNTYQLEILGDYFMEQMHTGELHEIMDERMGGEGSESLRQVHTNMGQMFYCGEQGAMPMGRMNMMMGRGSYEMMGGYPLTYYKRTNSIGFQFILLFFIIVIIIMIVLIIFLIKQLTIQRRRG